MFNAYRSAGDRLEPMPADGEVSEAVWIDLCDPTADEERLIEAALGLDIPTRQELAEIEESSRVYAEGEALFLTVVVCEGVGDGTGSGQPGRGTATFVLTPSRLVTVRYADPMPFRTFAARIERNAGKDVAAPSVLVALLETIVDRIADILEMVSTDLNEVSSGIFYDPPAGGPPAPRPDMQSAIRILGRKNHVLSLVRESMLSIGRLMPFLRQDHAGRFKGGLGNRLKTVERDIKSLTAYEVQLGQQISYLHEAVTALIDIEQNAIIKVFSIAAVLFLPPTLVGTIYGMNFEFMPELHWIGGYPAALLAMVVSAILPYLWFKRRGWL